MKLLDPFKSTLVASALLLVIFTPKAFSQIELSAMAGYSLADKFDTYYGSAKISDNVSMGINLAFNMGYGKQIELGYERQEGDLKATNYYNFVTTEEKISVALDYILAGFVYNKEIPGSIAVPFGGISLGTAIATGQSGDYKGTDLWLFDVAPKIGIKLFPSEKIGIRLQTQLHIPMQGSGGGLSCGVGTGGSGCGVSLGGYTTITQLEFQGGIIFRFGGPSASGTSGTSKAKSTQQDLVWGSLSQDISAPGM